MLQILQFSRKKKKIIFSLQFDFRQKYSSTHALIHLADKIIHVTDKSNQACEIFTDLRKVFDTIDHHILLKKLQYYGVRGISNTWFASNLSNKMQFVSISGYKLNLGDV